MKPSARQLNRRGEGGRLREEILQAAARLLVSSPADTVTLRAIAREAGIAAPSIYPHFADRDAILDALVERNFERLGDACRAASAAAPPGIERLRAVSAAYVRFAEEHPGDYRILFERVAGNRVEPPHEYAAGIRAFTTLVEAFAGLDRPGADAVRDAQAFWAALHGMLVLVPATPGFPWRPRAELVDRLVAALTA
ncbi:TetR/AcrR family transcriptional regulator [Phytohabitans flavus]|uniref:TetR family transcriptional regulator n=1 Tax=Phytohabitans flavus TaxID=1076124 RepID=A0A6F8XPK1_9ACTN|nr:TetR/AcrR family transcriptional regulator [Phytohabitans flavus]BCB75755.1 TetR family transcriptional regulator [Phytohabitans flavus]